MLYLLTQIASESRVKIANLSLESSLYYIYIVIGLEKFASFEVVVAAGTSLGYGPFSNPTSVKTLEDGMKY